MRIEPRQPGTPPSAALPAPRSEFAERLGRLLAETVDDRRALERAASRPAGGASSPADLLALQARLYQYVERVELMSRVVDRAAGAVKTVLQTQV